MNDVLDPYREINKNVRFAVVTVLFIVLKLFDYLMLGWGFIAVAIFLDVYLVISAGLNIKKGAVLHNNALVEAGLLEKGEGLDYC